MFCLGAQRHRLVLSPNSANCGADSQKRLPLRRALWAYRSLGLGALRLIHMKCGAIPALALLFHRSFSYGKTDGSSPLTGRQAKLVEMVLKIRCPKDFSFSGWINQFLTQTDQTRDS